MIETQMLKGVIDGVILKLIKNKETYGYEIVEELKMNGFYNMTEGTVYPILQRLSRKGYLMSTYKKSDLGPKRKYYYITATGKDYLDEFLNSYKQLQDAVNNVFKI